MNEDNISQDDFLKAFGVTAEPANDPSTNGNATDPTPASDEGNPASDDAVVPNTDNATGATDNAESQNGDAKAGEESQNSNNNNNPAVSKSANAFAAMRVELAQKNKILEGVASVLGLDPKSKDSMGQLQSKLNESLAKKQGLPVETLERLNRLEAMEEERNMEQVRTNAFMGFQNIKTTFKLSDEDLQAFANDLVADGKNPFIQAMDLVTEYKIRNFDKLIAQAKAEGAQNEIARASKAQNNASTPNNTTGGVDDATQDKITSVKQLNEWFKQHTS